MAEPKVSAAVCSPKPEDRQQEIDETAKMSVAHAQPPSTDLLASRSQFTTDEPQTSSDTDAAALTRRAACFAAEAPVKTSASPENPAEAAKLLGIDPALVIGNWAESGKQDFRPTGLELLAIKRDATTKKITHFQRGPFNIHFTYETKNSLRDGKVAGTYTVITGINVTYGNQNITAQAIVLKDGSYLVALEGIWRGELLHLFGSKLDRLVEISPRGMRQAILQACRNQNRGATIPSIDEPGKRDSFRDAAHKSKVEAAIFVQLAQNIPSKATPVAAATTQSKAAEEPSVSTPAEPAPECPPKEAPTVVARVISEGDIIPIKDTAPIPIKLQSSLGDIDAALQLVSAKIVDETKPRDEQEVEETYRFLVEKDGGTPPNFVHQFDFTVRRKAINYYGREGKFRLNHDRQPLGITYQSSEMDALSPTVTLDRNTEHFLIQTVSGERSSTISLSPSYLMVLATKGKIPNGFPPIILEGNLPTTVAQKANNDETIRLQAEYKDRQLQQEAELKALEELEKRIVPHINTDLHSIVVELANGVKRNAWLQLDSAEFEDSLLGLKKWKVRETYALYLEGETTPVLFEVVRNAIHQRADGSIIVNHHYHAEGAIDTALSSTEGIGFASGERAASIELSLRGGTLKIASSTLTQLSSAGKLDASTTLTHSGSLPTRLLPVSETEFIDLALESRDRTDGRQIRLASAILFNTDAPFEEWKVEETYIIRNPTDRTAVEFKLTRNLVERYKNPSSEGFRQSRNYHEVSEEAIWYCEDDKEGTVEAIHFRGGEEGQTTFFLERNGRTLEVPKSLLSSLATRGVTGNYSLQLTESVIGLFPIQKTEFIPIGLEASGNKNELREIRLASVKTEYFTTPEGEINWIARETYIIRDPNDQSSIEFDVTRNLNSPQADERSHGLTSLWYREGQRDNATNGESIGFDRDPDIIFIRRNGRELQIPRAVLKSLATQGNVGRASLKEIVDPEIIRAEKFGQLFSDEKIIPRTESKPEKVKIRLANGEEKEIFLQLRNAEVINPDVLTPEDLEIEETYSLVVDGSTELRFKVRRLAIQIYGKDREDPKVILNHHYRAQSALLYLSRRAQSVDFSTGERAASLLFQVEGQTLTLHSSLLLQLSTTGEIASNAVPITLEADGPQPYDTIETSEVSTKVETAEREFKAEIAKEIHNEKNKTPQRIENSLSLMKAHPYNPAFKALVLAIEDMYISDHGTRNKILYELFDAYTKTVFLPLNLEDPKQSVAIERLGKLALEKVYRQREEREQKLTDLKKAAELKEEETRKEWESEIKKLMEDGR